MGTDFDILETAEVCREQPEKRLDRDVEDVIHEYGVNGFVQAVMRSTAGHTVERVSGGINQMKAIIWILSEVMNADKPRLTAECIALATGIHASTNTTMTEVARRHGMSKANVSRRVIEISDKLGMSPSSCMKTAKDRQEYGLTNGATRKHKTKGKENERN